MDLNVVDQGMLKMVIAVDVVKFATKYFSIMNEKEPKPRKGVVVLSRDKAGKPKSVGIIADPALVDYAKENRNIPIQKK